MGSCFTSWARAFHPFEGADLPSRISRILHAQPVAPSEISSVGDPQVDAIVAKCLRKEPAQRYRATSDLVRDLEQLHQRLAPRPNASPRRSARRAAAADDRGRSGLWWWRMHQLSAAFLYGLMVYPVWRVQEWIGPPWGLVLLLAVLVPIVAAGALRLHLWFTASYYYGHLARQRALTAPWIRGADVAFVAGLLANAAAVSARHNGYAAIMTVFAVGASVAFLIVEPATARAAFLRTPSRSGGRKTPRNRSGSDKGVQTP